MLPNWISSGVGRVKAERHEVPQVLCWPSDGDWTSFNETAGDVKAMNEPRRGSFALHCGELVREFFRLLPRDVVNRQLGSVETTVVGPHHSFVFLLRYLGRAQAKCLGDPHSVLGLLR